MTKLAMCCSSAMAIPSSATAPFCCSSVSSSPSRISYFFTAISLVTSIPKKNNRRIVCCPVTSALVVASHRPSFLNGGGGNGDVEFCVVTFYKFVSIDDPEGEVAKHHAFLQGLDIHGRIYVNEQGINAQYSGPSEVALAYADWLKEDPRFSDILVQTSPALYGHAFPRLKMRYKPSLVQFEGGMSHLPVLDPTLRATPVTPTKWRNRLQVSSNTKKLSNKVTGSNHNRRLLLLDVRNGYEWDVGHFQGAERPQVDSFRHTNVGLSSHEMPPRRDRSVSLDGEPSGAANQNLVFELQRSILDLRAEVAQLHAAQQATTQGQTPHTGGILNTPANNTPTGTGNAAGSNANTGGIGNANINEPLVPAVVLAPIDPDVTLRFQKLKPPSYDGNRDYYIISEWFLQMEKHFAYGNVGNDQRVHLAVYQLKEDAYVWWQQSYTLLGDGPIEWDQFKEVLTQKFLPDVERDRLLEAFIALRQNAESVTDYEREFSRLSRFAPDLVSTELKKISRFMKGLRSHYRQLVVAHGAQTYAETVAAALTVEGIQNEQKLKMEQRDRKPQVYDKKRKGEFSEATSKKVVETCAFCHKRGHSAQVCRSLLAKQVTVKPAQRTLAVTPVICAYCKKPGHTVKDCKKRNKQCFKCGKVGHYIGSCPLTEPIAAEPLRTLPPPPKTLDKGKGKMNAITEMDALKSTDVISVEGPSGA